MRESVPLRNKSETKINNIYFSFFSTTQEAGEEAEGRQSIECHTESERVD